MSPAEWLLIIVIHGHGVGIAGAETREQCLRSLLTVPRLLDQRGYDGRAICVPEQGERT